MANMDEKTLTEDERKILDALKLLTSHIGCFGKRMQEEISLHWGNGLVLRCNGALQTSGTQNVAKEIAAMEAEKFGALET